MLSGNLEVALDPIGAKPGDFVVTIGISAARIAAGNPKITTDLTIGGIIDHWDEERWRVTSARLRFTASHPTHHKEKPDHGK